MTDSKNKKSQSEVITTVLLILIGILAVSIVSVFIVNLVRNNLRGSECTQILSQISISDSEWTFFNSTSKLLYLNIERETKDFELAGLYVMFGDSSNTKALKIVDGTNNYVYSINSTGGLNTTVTLPKLGEKRTYVIDSVAAGFTNNVTLASISLILPENINCGESDRKVIEPK